MASPVEGNIDANDPDKGPPVKVGGKYSATLPTLADGDRGDLQVNASSELVVGGQPADNAADVGNPVKVGARYNSSEQTYATGDRADLQADATGRLLVSRIKAPAVTVWAVGTFTGTATSADVQSRGAIGAHLVLDFTVKGTDAGLTVKLQRKDTLSGKYVDLPGGAFAATTNTLVADLVVYPGVAETANVSVSDCLSEYWRAVATMSGNAPTATFSLGGTLLP